MQNWIVSEYRGIGKCKLTIRKNEIRKPKSFKFSPVFLLMLSILCIFTSPVGQNVLQHASHSNSFISVRNCSDAWQPSSVKKVNTNFESRYKYGNKQKNGIKIMHWNSGGKHLVNKMDNIESVVNGYKPHILGISEANLLKRHDVNDVQIENYKLFHSNTIFNNDIEASRVVVYVHNEIACKLREDLMNDKFSSIWLEINLPRQKKFLVCHAYRDWQYLNQGNKVSKSLDAQLVRWVEFLNQWENGLKTDLECLVVGDLNLDHTKWTKDNLSPNSITAKLKPLIEILFDKILPYGIVQCVVGPTRFESNSTSSGLDHFWTSNPNKLSDVHTYFHGSSDHKLLIGTRYTKSVVRNPRYIKKRSYKNFNPNLFIQAVKRTSWWELYSCDDPEYAVEIFTRKLNVILDEMAPIRKFQVRPKYAPWLTNSTKELMNERDLAQKRAACTGDSEDWKEFKQLRYDWLVLAWW